MFPKRRYRTQFIVPSISEQNRSQKSIRSSQMVPDSIDFHDGTTNYDVDCFPSKSASFWTSLVPRKDIKKQQGAPVVSNEQKVKLIPQSRRLFYFRLAVHRTECSCFLEGSSSVGNLLRTPSCFFSLSFYYFTDFYPLAVTSPRCNSSALYAFEL